MFDHRKPEESETSASTDRLQKADILFMRSSKGIQSRLAEELLKTLAIAGEMPVRQEGSLCSEIDAENERRQSARLPSRTFRKSRQLHPKGHEVETTLGQGQKRQAAEDGSTARERKTLYAASHFGALLQRSGQHREARRHLHRAAVLAEVSHESPAFRAYLYRLLEESYVLDGCTELAEACGHLSSLLFRRAALLQEQ